MKGFFFAQPFGYAICRLGYFFLNGGKNLAKALAKVHVHMSKFALKIFLLIVYYVCFIL